MVKYNKKNSIYYWNKHFAITWVRIFYRYL